MELHYLLLLACRDGNFGSDCLQDCHCIDGMPCDVFTGRCEGGCKNGWSGEGCQGKVSYWAFLETGEGFN